MVAFISSILILVGIVAIGMSVGKRRPVGKHLTWGESLVAATFTFFGFFYAYGLVPHLWLTWADSELKWRPDVLLSDYAWFGGTARLSFLSPQEKGGALPLTITMQTLRDIIAVLIYVVLLGFNMWLWAWWQKRGTKAAVTSTDVVTSDYGRPLVKKA